MQYKKYFKTAVNLSVLAICTINIIWLQKANLKQQELVKNDNFYLQQEKKISSTAKIQNEIPSFGFNNLLADLTFLRYLQYFGDVEAREVTGYSVVTDYFENIVNRDPNFVQSHLVMSAANSLFAAKPKITVELIDKALETVTPNTPNYPFLLWTYKATDEILFLGDLQSAEKSYEIAAKWAKTRQDELGNNMAKRYETTAAYLATNPDPTQAQIGAWMSVLSSAKDKKTIDYVVNKLEDLGVSVSMTNDGKLVVKHSKDV